jgi:adenylate cyclase
MAEHSTVRRRLAAILAADVVGYSRMIGVDETGTLARLRELRREIANPLIAEHGGRIFKVMGDGLLAEFPSAVLALRAAIGIQERMRDRNAQVSEAERIELRIGVHQGDVVVEGGDLLGDGVNIAARLETLAEPGSICISARVHEDATGKVQVEALDMGEQTLKNIARPVRAYAVLSSGGASKAPAQMSPSGGAYTLPLPDKPSLAVLPFQNMSGDPEQEYFADGMVEEIITALSRVRSFFVIARNSSFTYKGKSVDVKQVGRDLGVRYVLEGSVRKVGGRVRITGQLVEAANGHHVWPDRFEGSMEDIFDLQDRVTESVAAAIEPSLKGAEIARARAKPTENLDVYDLYLKALSLHYRGDRAASHDAIRLLRKALRMDPNFVLARVQLASIHMFRVERKWSEPKEVAQGVRLAHQAARAGREDPLVLRLAGLCIAYLARDYETGMGLIDRSLALNPNSAQEMPTFVTAYQMLIRSLIGLKRLDEARSAGRRLIEVSPTYTLSYYRSIAPMKNAAILAESEEAQRQAGIPE